MPIVSFLQLSTSYFILNLKGEKNQSRSDSIMKIKSGHREGLETKPTDIISQNVIETTTDLCQKETSMTP